LHVAKFSISTKEGKLFLAFSYVWLVPPKPGDDDSNGGKPQDRFCKLFKLCFSKPTGP
jgi:hypothetical protein